jgi:hypothetical protein
MRTLILAMALALAVTAPAGALEEQAKPDAASVNVTVKYTGKGTVDANHKLWVWLFDSPEIGPGAIPIAEEPIEKNGGVARFTNVTAAQVYIAVAYDEKGGFAGNAPPPTGSPIAIHGQKAATDKPEPVAPGAKAHVTMTFADATRMP